MAGAESGTATDEERGQSMEEALYHCATSGIQEDPMHIARLRRVGGSRMLAVPPARLNALHLAVGSKVGCQASTMAAWLLSRRPGLATPWRKRSQRPITRNHGRRKNRSGWNRLPRAVNWYEARRRFHS